MIETISLGIAILSIVLISAFSITAVYLVMREKK